MEIQWRKSSKSTDAEDNCVEIATHEGEILMRESDAPHVVVRTSRAKFRAFLAGAREGEFDDMT
ncbi:DUF397 domain-containing protein [Streptomyces paromomycinus]|uniref:Transcriptional regulator n=1 Tax=Streptomyces paromomycinus TaxID=92743 RepID=A0A401W7R0_STREY|nr:DUF397 domain-containing protein [Streptomyces paromomycinus]GCD45378.1 transcriptional regulator [Streptomyces paromomycinus]